ncbi:MAG: hypothetical protein P857_844 [Candidatus Xenolissoclinum pacificiensis L6]|uniref:Transposase n=1 Tax=Candidatus Xenolissoclinum pacificiensis L6 TaxID=1401685 RepID=W2V0A9_9RICK|nr:MAG: hypothetical protein P857_844 [Candidatus Xenolissoclinum pacificiensis L6]
MLIIDATEQPMARPKKKQKIMLFWEEESSYYTEVRINNKRRIVQVSKSYPGSSQ